MSRTDLFWLPSHPDFAHALKRCRTSEGTPGQRLELLQALANHNLDFVQTANVYRTLQPLTTLTDGTPALPTIKLALLGSSTLDQLLPSLHVAALRRGFLLNCYTGSFNQYQQELLDSSSGLYAFQPDVIALVLHEGELETELALDAPTAVVTAAVHKKVDEWRHLWSLAKTRTGAAVIHSTVVVPPLQIFGQLDGLIPASPPNVLSQFNTHLKQKAAEEGVLVLDLEGLAARIGKYDWCNFSMWFHAKQSLPVAHSPICGDFLARLIGAARGFSKKCLVLDLDNTLWGGIIGDDGLEHILLGQGHAVGEAFQAFQRYVKQLKDRGIILAVCSKNDEVNARLPFEKHPEMILHSEDIAVFFANWETKAANLERIASTLNIGVDALVFFDDNPAEREQIRQLLPKVAVPETPPDPADYAFTLSEAGYFEAAAFTTEDKQRTASYQTIVQQAQLSASPHDLEGFLKGLSMEMEASRFNDLGLQRIAQLINKSNQFNLTTRRYTEAQVKEFASDTSIFTLQIRLKDRLADHGMISVIIARPLPETREKTLYIDTWLMSCRVLGRQVESAVLNLIMEHAQRQGYAWVVGDYIETAKNGLVRDHYSRLGFSPVTQESPKNVQRWRLPVSEFSARTTTIHVTAPERTPS